MTNFGGGRTHEVIAKDGHEFVAISATLHAHDIANIEDNTLQTKLETLRDPADPPLVIVVQRATPIRRRKLRAEFIQNLLLVRSS